MENEAQVGRAGIRAPCLPGWATVGHAAECACLAGCRFG